MTIEPAIARGPLVAVLAAGSARRFGGGKLDAPLGQRRLGQWALASALDSGFDVVVVVPKNLPQFALEAQATLGIRLIENALAAHGMGTSVACAARVASTDHAGLIILLADMPFVDGRALNRLVDPGCASFARHVDGRPGPPAWIPAWQLPRLFDLSGERGARSVLGTGDMRLVDWPADQLIDIDTADALARAQALVSGVRSA